MRLLAIETSCDETAVAVVSKKNGVESSLVASQIHLHQPFGGVVPEVACRAHQEWLPRLVKQSLSDTGITPAEIDGIAVTRGPGLIGALLVGLSFARGLAWGWQKPWVGINHLEGHIASLDLSDPPFDPPYVALLASGGHTDFFHVDPDWHIRFLGGTLDDAAGEAFDKVAHLLQLGYPGGPVIEKAAGNHHGPIHDFPIPMSGHRGCNISFSGLKTAVALAVEKEGNAIRNGQAAYWAASFQRCVIMALVKKLEAAADMVGCSRVAIVGGVAANRLLRDTVASLAEKHGWEVGVAPMKYCGDNAAMIGVAALRHLEQRGWSSPDLDADPRLFLGEE